VSRFALALISAAAALLLVACVGDDTSPAGVGLLPEDVVGNLQIAVSSNFELTTDYGVFPADRDLAERLITAHDWPTANDFESRAVFQFQVADLDSLPEGTEFTEHRLRLIFIAPPEEVSIGVHRLTSAWSEEAATWNQRELGQPWNTPGGDFDPELVARFDVLAAPPDTTPGDTTSAVTVDTLSVGIPADLVAGWLAGTTPNHGLILIQETPGAVVDFASRDVQGNPLSGPVLEVDALLPDSVTAATLQFPATEDVFLALDESPMPPGGLVVRGAEPPRRTVLKSVFEEVPIGATVASVQLVMTIRAVDVPRDSLFLLAVPLVTDFRGESTILALVSGLSPLATIRPEAQPGDTVVFESIALTSLVRQWVARPETNHGIALRLPEAGPISENLVFGGVQFYGPEAAVEVRPRVRIAFVRSAVPGETE
jgi:hypothetical protein